MPASLRLGSVAAFQTRPSVEVQTAPLVLFVPATTNPGPPGVRAFRLSSDGKSMTSVQAAPSLDHQIAAPGVEPSVYGMSASRTYVAPTFATPTTASTLPIPDTSCGFQSTTSGAAAAGGCDGPALAGTALGATDGIADGDATWDGVEDARAVADGPGATDTGGSVAAWLEHAGASSAMAGTPPPRRRGRRPPAAACPALVPICRPPSPLSSLRAERTTPRCGYETGDASGRVDVVVDVEHVVGVPRALQRREPGELHVAVDRAGRVG